MGSPLPPDPYLALGVPKDANQAAVKTAHRKLVLKCHPDKVTDPAAKQAASDQFHKIQTAYEILVDEDRRARYDAQVRLADLKREAMERQGGESSRGAERSAPSPYKSSQDYAAPRGSYNVRPGDRTVPQYEERRPSYAPADYFDPPPPRASVRKDHEHERGFRRPASDSKDKARTTSTREAKEKEAEKERRREKTRRAEQDARRDRDRKYSAAQVEDDSESDSDEYARRSRRMREEDEREKLRKARDAYSEQAYKQKQEATSGYFTDDRTRKMFAATSDAWDYIRSSNTSRRKPEPERRPSPVRQGSSKDKFDYVKGKDGRPSVVLRRGSERPKTSGRDSEQARRTSPRATERRSSAEDVSEVRPTPTLNTSRSSPADIRTLSSEKPRAQSVQVEKDSGPEIPSVKRAETMPYNTGASRRSENTIPQRSRPTEFPEGLATPATTPEWTGPFAPPIPTSKANYGRQYADDGEYPTPDGFRVTELRQPEGGRPKFTRKLTRSPSPGPSPARERERDPRDVRESRDSRELPRDSRERERPERRTTSSRYPETTRPSLANNTRTTSYVYNPGASGVEPLDRSRPSTARGVDPRDPRGGPLYGEVRPSTGSPRQKVSAFEPPEEQRYHRTPRAEDLRFQSGSGYYRKPSTDRPTLSRNGSGNQPIYTSARA